MGLKSPNMDKRELQVKAITHKIKTGKAKNPNKAKAKIRQIQINKSKAQWLAQ